ncbi:HPF/RaiA family ribosome-associated protein [Breoghania sp. L-A4]|uniref:HPF/RaiA family ribosome-associated protein n=1 Tax=Breoghania sp. L-A4 TaxID=2304600 RepID=UPI000E35F3BF|nr:HPF/RaiA family ribosome-associated protein [Breoghania sp. L-A4]AXS41408.1 HPF/RaiA family ribosome-associated protein [Breoghania sp. L-A4]
MQVDPQITYRNMEPSAHVEERIHERIAKLEEFHGRITSCRVTVEAPHQRGQKGEIYKISIDVEVPGGHVVVNREPGKNHAHEDVLVAIRDAFNAAQRQLEDHVRKTGGIHVKDHPPKTHGKVTDKFVDEAYGFIDAADGRRFFFRADSVNGQGWNDMEIGSQVHFTEMDGEMGLHAVSVTVI